MSTVHEFLRERGGTTDPRRALAREFAILRTRLDALPEIAPAIPLPVSPLVVIARLFGLHDAERDVLALAAGAELDPSLAEGIARICGSGTPDVALAIGLRPDEGWDAFDPGRPLRRWQLVDLVGSGAFMRRALRADERILHALMGLPTLDTRLEGLVRRSTPTPSMRGDDTAETIASAWADPGDVPVVLVGGEAGSAAKEDRAAAAAHAAGLPLLCLDASDLPTEWAGRETLATLLAREMLISGAALLIRCDSGAGEHAAAARLADALDGRVVITATDPHPPARRASLRLDLSAATLAGRKHEWRIALGPRADALGSGLDRLAERFVLRGREIEASVRSALAAPPVEPHRVFGRLWAAARVHARRSIDGLAERIDSTATWDDLVLPADQTAQLRDLTAHVRESWRVNEAWGWAARSPRGLGAAALFAGPSGTGKTLAAEVIAAELALDLYRIDLSQVVSKYIGETEKNLSRIFAAAEDGGAILLFDEADALFGKRSEVKDSHDRYANVEVSYLLQRMEAYRGLAILTTNQKSALDQAFLRRLRHVVTFPFPDAAARARIWTVIFPRETPTEGLDPDRLARMNLTGGSIRSVAFNASFLAAAAGSPVRPEHILAAARREYAKLEKPLTAAELGALQ